MLILFVLALVGLTLSEQYAGPAFSGVMASGNMEGKEIIHGVGTSALGNCYHGGFKWFG